MKSMNDFIGEQQFSPIQFAYKHPEQFIKNSAKKVKNNLKLIEPDVAQKVANFVGKTTKVVSDSVEQEGAFPADEISEIIGNPSKRNIDRLLEKSRELRSKVNSRSVSPNKPKLWWLFQKIADFFNWIWSMIRKVYNAIVPESIQNLLSSIVKNIKLFFIKVWTGIKTFFKEIFKGKDEAERVAVKNFLEADDTKSESKTEPAKAKPKAENSPKPQGSVEHVQKKVKYVKKQIFTITLTASALIIVYILIKYFIKSSQHNGEFNIVEEFNKSQKIVLEQENSFESSSYSILSVLFKIILWPFKTILADYSNTISKAYDQSGKIKNKYDIYVQILVITHLALIVLLGIQIKNLVS